ncbi:MAG: AarF/UbiB family protein [Deferrisomatales bacterium]|nr:AarF/UbiB family protein [Deferrisomatales bacterium]
MPLREMADGTSTLGAAARLVQIAVVLGCYGLVGALLSLVRRSWVPLARELCRGFERLGPAFVKLGQFLSVRPDLVPPSALDEFERLQDRAREVPFRAVEGVLAAELLAPPGDLFCHLDPVPLAAASLSQVHRGRLADGTEVAVKVQRPGVAALLRRDFRLLAGLLGVVIPLSPLRGRLDPRALARELTRAVEAELDFRVEAEHAAAFRRNFRHCPGLRVPRVYWTHTGRRVLTTEFVAGEKISAVVARGRGDYRQLAELGAAAFLQQIVVDGLFHADLHPANLLITPAGEIAYLDFGIVGTLSTEERRAIFGALAGLLARDAPLALRHLAILGVRVPPHRITGFAEDVGRVLDAAAGTTLAQVSVARIGRGLLAAIHRHRVVLPRRQALLVKALLTVEGSARLLHPTFSFEDAARKTLFGCARKELSWSRLAEAAWRAGALLGLAAVVAAAPPVPSSPPPP